MDAAQVMLLGRRRLNLGVMHKTIAALLLLFLGACASTPEELCDHGDLGLAVLATAPPEASNLLSELRAEFPLAIDDRRDHVVWLRSHGGDLYLCTYKRRPARTGACGATVHQFAQTAEGYKGGNVSVSACH